jgi:recombination protein RecT
MNKSVEKTKQAVAETKITTVYDFLEKKRDLIARALPKTITPERLIGVFTMILRSSPALMECTQASLVAAVIQTVQLGLTPGNINHCYYIPFNNKGKKEVQFILSYRGMIELVNRSGKASILTAECVYSLDDFKYEQGLNPILRHVPASSARGDFIGVYCIAKNLVANEKVFVFLSAAEVDKVKQASKAKSSEYSPWNTWFEEMAKKTAVKRIFKMLPMSVEEQERVSADETIKTDIDVDMTKMPDKANWEEAETIPESEPEAPAKMPIKASDEAVAEQSQEQAEDDADSLANANVGAFIEEFQGLVKGVAVKENVGKNKTAKISTYQVESAGGAVYSIAVFGSPEDVEDALCFFRGIKVKEWQGQKQFLAESVIAC